MHPLSRVPRIRPEPKYEPRDTEPQVHAPRYRFGSISESTRIRSAQERDWSICTKDIWCVKRQRLPLTGPRCDEAGQQSPYAKICFCQATTCRR